MLTIVLIDDDPISTFVTEKLISKNVSQACQFFKYQSAKEALQEISSIKPHYLFLDLNMPEMNGWQVCAYLRQLSHVPIIMLTARG